VSCAVHLGSVDNIISILSMAVIILLPVALSKWFESVTSGTYRQLNSGIVATTRNTWGDEKNQDFFLKMIYLQFEQKHLIPFKIFSIGGNTFVQSLSRLWKHLLNC